MKIAVLSDLHASLVQFEAVLADAARVGVDAFVCLGDLNDLGPEPTELVRRVRELGIPCLKGNHDVVDGPPLPPPHVNAWCRSKLDADARAFLASLPTELSISLPGGRTLLCVHGSPRFDEDEILANTPDALLDEWCAAREFSVLAAGHTHLQLLRRHRGRTFINPGSVGLPFREQPVAGPPRVLPQAEYAIISCDPNAVCVDFRCVGYDFGEYARRVHSSGLPGPQAWLAAFA